MELVEELELDLSLGGSSVLSIGVSLQSGLEGSLICPDLVRSGQKAPMRTCLSASSNVRRGADNMSREYTSSDFFPDEWCPSTVRWWGSEPALASHESVVAFKL